ncbi:MAG: nitrate/nitrite transporter NrtS [Acidimicrobiia bacterium]
MSEIRRSTQGPTPKWETVAEVPSVVFHPANLRRTIPIALVTGIVLFSINQLDVIVRDPGSTMAWIKSGLTFLVPFCVSNLGILTASREQAPAFGPAWCLSTTHPDSDGGSNRKGEPV